MRDEEARVGRMNEARREWIRALARWQKRNKGRGSARWFSRAILKWPILGAVLIAKVQRYLKPPLLLLWGHCTASRVLSLLALILFYGIIPFGFHALPPLLFPGKCCPWYWCFNTRCSCRNWYFALTVILSSVTLCFTSAVNIFYVTIIDSTRGTTSAAWHLLPLRSSVCFNISLPRRSINQVLISDRSTNHNSQPERRNVNQTKHRPEAQVI